MLFFELQADGIMLGIGQLGQPVRHPEHKQDGGIAAHRRAGIALFNLEEGRPADGGTLRGDFSRNASTPPRIPDIMAEFAQGAGDRDRQHGGGFLFSHKTTSIITYVKTNNVNSNLRYVNSQQSTMRSGRNPYITRPPALSTAKRSECLGLLLCGQEGGLGVRMAPGADRGLAVFMETSRLLSRCLGRMSFRRLFLSRLLADIDYLRNEHFAKFGLTLNLEKTRLIEFGRFAVVDQDVEGGLANDLASWASSTPLHDLGQKDQELLLRLRGVAFLGGLLEQKGLVVRHPDAPPTVVSFLRR